MATPIGPSFANGQSTSSLLLFNDTNCMFWKASMRIFIQALDYNMWGVITNGSYIPTILINGVPSPKLENDWKEFEKMAQLNAKAINILYYSLNVNEFSRISTYISIKKNWDRLEIIHEETSQVKESKMNNMSQFLT